MTPNDSLVISIINRLRAIQQRYKGKMNKYKGKSNRYEGKFTDMRVSSQNNEE